MKFYKITKFVYNIVARGLSPSLSSNLASIVNIFLISRWKSDQSGEVRHSIVGVNDCSLKALFGPDIIEVAFSAVFVIRVPGTVLLTEWVVLKANVQLIERQLIGRQRP